MPSAIDLLAEWLAEDTANRDCDWIYMETDGLVVVRINQRVKHPGKPMSYCGFGPTPDAAIRAAVEKARRG